MIGGRDVLSALAGIVFFIVLFFLVTCIVSSVNKVTVGQQIADWFNPEIVAEQPDDTTGDDTTGGEDDTNGGEQSGDDTTGDENAGDDESGDETNNAGA